MGAGEFSAETAEGRGSPSAPEDVRKRHILTIAVEDYFHVAALRGAIRHKHWDRLDPPLDANLTKVLELLDRYRVTATFFVFGCVAERQLETVQRIVARGHEVASRGYRPRSLRGIDRADFLDDLRRARDVLEAAGAGRVVGYRAPSWIGSDQLWMLDVLAEEGYLYDSSINPVLRSFADRPEEFRIHQHQHSRDRRLSLWEFPISTESLFGTRIA